MPPKPEETASQSASAKKHGASKPAAAAKKPGAAAAKPAAGAPKPGATAALPSRPAAANTGATNNNTPIPARELIKRFTMFSYGADSTSTEYNSTSPEFSFIASCCLMAIKLLRRNDSQAALKILAGKCIDYWQGDEFRKLNPGPEYHWHGEKTKIKDYVKVFTEGVLQTPPAIYVDPTLKECYACHTTIPGYDGNFEILRTQNCFVFKLPLEIVKAAQTAMKTQKENIKFFRTLRMVLSLALWHEFMHGFVTYLAGKAWSRTPPHVIPKYLMPDEKDLKEGTPLGESGDYMECLVWGGSFQMDFPYNDAAIQKCREPFAVDRNNVEKLIDMATVTDFLRSPMTFELKKAVQGKPARPRSPTPEPQPAKKKRMAGSFLGEPRPKVVRAWDIHYELDSNALPIVIKKEATTVES